MSKRKAQNEESSDEDMAVMDVEFEWFDPQPAVDFEGLKTLLRQLLGADFTLINLSELSDLILSQPLLGSTVKVDGNESDPFAFLTVLNLHTHKDKPVIQQLVKYILGRTSLAELDVLKDDKARVGLLLTERLINCPSEVVPPMYKMLQEEIQWALEEKEPYDFTHYLVLSKTYIEVESKLEQKPSKRSKATSEVFYFHPEDEVLQKHALAYGGYIYSKEEDEGVADSRRTFQDLGIRPEGRLILLQADKFEGAVKAIESFLT